jgi:hypothetical protein
MNYDELAEKLRNNHFYPSIETRVKNKSKTVEGLHVDSPPILRDERKKRLEDIVGEDYSVKWVGDGEKNQYFLIKKK